MIFVTFGGEDTMPLLHSLKAVFKQFPLRNAGLATPGTMVRLRFALPAVRSCDVGLRFKRSINN